MRGNIQDVGSVTCKSQQGVEGEEGESVIVMTFW